MNVKALGTAFIALTLTACSSQPREPAATTKAPATVAATAAPAAAVAAPAAALNGTPTASTSSQPPVLNRTLISAGYKATTIKGEVFYCRTVDVTGTQFKKKVCLTEAQLKDEERKIQQMQDEMM